MFGIYHKSSSTIRGAAILEYVIIAVGVSIFCTFGILKYGKALQGQINAATQVLSGNALARDTSIHDEPRKDAEESSEDSISRTGEGMSRQ